MRLFVVVLCVLTACVRFGYDGGLDSGPASEGPVSDASFSDASVNDASVSDGRADDAAGSLCAGFTGMFCDDFESSLDQFIVDPAQGTVAITEGAARTGSGGLHVTLDGSGGSVLFADFDPITSGQIYVSAWVRLAATTTLSGWLVLFELRQNPYTDEKISLDGESGDRFQINVATEPVSKSSEAGMLPRNAWTCMEMFVDIGDQGSAWVRVGNERLDVPLVDTLPESGGFNRMLVGLSTDGQSMEAFFDDLRIGPQVYGCSE